MSVPHYSHLLTRRINCHNVIFIVQLIQNQFKMSKRNLLTHLQKQKKKLKGLSELAVSTKTDSEVTSVGSNLPNNAESALNYLKSTFPVEKFNEQLPPVLLVHQVYSIITCKTLVDKEVDHLQSKGILHLFKLGGEEKALVAIFSDDFKCHVRKHCVQKPVINHFLNEILPEVQDVSVDKGFLKEKYGLTQQDISDLVGAGLLTIRFAASYWFSFPNAGEFMKIYLKGRKSILRTIRKCKFGEILKNELEKRTLEKSAKFGIQYHIHDIIGAELVKCIDTSSGILLRFVKSKK